MTRRPSSPSQLPLLLQLAAIAFACLALILPLATFAFAPSGTIGTTEIVLLVFLTLYCVTTGGAIALLCRLLSPGGAWEMSLVSASVPDPAPAAGPELEPSPPPRSRRARAPSPPPGPPPPPEATEEADAPAGPPEEIVGGRLSTSGPPRMSERPEEVMDEPEADLSDVIVSDPPPAPEPVRRITPQATPPAEEPAPPLLPADARALRELYADIRSYVDLEFWTMALVKSRELIARFPATREAATLQRNMGFLESRAKAAGDPRPQRQATAA